MKRKVFFLLILIFSLEQVSIFAQEASVEAEKTTAAEKVRASAGTDDSGHAVSLFEIDRLIRRTEYDEALRKLNIYMAAHPDNFDAAQQRIKRIMNARISYAELAEKLIQLIQTDPGNDKEIYELTSRLESFEKNPSDENLQFIADLKKSAEFNYFRALFMEIQTAAVELAKNGSYSAAIDKLKEGFWLYRDDFYEQWEENPDLIAGVEEIMAALDRTLKAYQDKNLLPKINDSVAQFVKAVNQDSYDEALERYADVKNQLTSYYALRKAVFQSALQLNEKFAFVQKLDGDVSDASYLPFLYRFITGLSSLEDSGILGVMDRRWDAYISEMNNAVFAMLNQKYMLFEEGINENYSLAIHRYAELEGKVIGLYDLTAENGKNLLENKFYSTYVQTVYLDKLASATERLAKLNSDIGNLKKELDESIKVIKNREEEVDDESIMSLFASISNISGILGIKDEQELENVEWGSEYREKNYHYWDSLDLIYSDYLASAFEESGKILSSVWYEIGAAFSQRSDSFVVRANTYHTALKAYEDGLDSRLSADELAQINKNAENAVKFYAKSDELELGIKYSYPNVTLALASYAKDYVNKSIFSIDDYSKDMRENFNSNIQWKTDKKIVDIVDNSLSYFSQKREELVKLLESIQSSHKTASAKITAAQLAKNEADVRFSEAENALKKDDFDTARRKLQEALSKYNESLNNQDDENFSSNIDGKLLALGERINKAENEVVVRDVRELKNLAKDAYFNGRFDDAEKYLSEAKNRWAITNITEDEEIKSLLAFVETALSMNSGRVILPSAPQYPEMSQLLNISNQYYDDGVALLKKGAKKEAEESFKNALSNIRKVQYVYPLNQEAALLTLKINRELDPQKFQEEFAQKIEASKLLCQKADTRQEGYANLLDYYELEPGYKGLKELIYQVEIDIGIRQRPVTKSGENNAKKLISQAQALYKNEGNNNNSLKKALALVDEALTMLPNDKTAMNLKDSITTKIGGNTVPVLSTDEERLYQLAVQRLQNNNVVGARALVNQILKKPQNGNLQKIKDLLVKIEARS